MVLATTERGMQGHETTDSQWRPHPPDCLKYFMRKGIMPRNDEDLNSSQKSTSQSEGSDKGYRYKAGDQQSSSPPISPISVRSMESPLNTSPVRRKDRKRRIPDNRDLNEGDDDRRSRSNSWNDENTLSNKKRPRQRKSENNAMRNFSPEDAKICCLDTCDNTVAKGLCPHTGNPKLACCQEHYDLYKQQKIGWNNAQPPKSETKEGRRPTRE